MGCGPGGGNQFTSQIDNGKLTLLKNIKNCITTNNN